MDSLFKRIRQRLSGGRAAAEIPRVIVAAFGKHPAWNDHMDDIGLQTPALVAAKRALYVDGIGKNIDNGKWAELEARQAGMEFGHTFVWRRGSDAIAGRLWPSQDGRGRASYPMVACVHCCRVPLRWVYNQVLPRLTQVEDECRNAKADSEVRACLAVCGAALAAQLEASPSRDEPPRAEPDLIGRLTDCIGPDADREGLIRVLYHIDREIGNASVARTGAEEYQSSVHARIPVSRGKIVEASLLWTSLLLEEYGADAGVLLIVPQQEQWLDVIVGAPSPSQLYCLRAPLEALPLTSTVPYTISDEFLRRMTQRTR